MTYRTIAQLIRYHSTVNILYILVFVGARLLKTNTLYPDLPTPKNNIGNLSLNVMPPPEILLKSTGHSFLPKQNDVLGYSRTRRRNRGYVSASHVVLLWGRVVGGCISIYTKFCDLWPVTLPRTFLRAVSLRGDFCHRFLLTSRVMVYDGSFTPWIHRLNSHES